MITIFPCEGTGGSPATELKILVLTRTFAIHIYIYIYYGELAVIYNAFQTEISGCHILAASVKFRELRGHPRSSHKQKPFVGG